MKMGRRYFFAPLAQLVEHLTFNQRVGSSSLLRGICPMCEYVRKGKTMKTLEIKGKVNTALCYAKVVEDEAIDQIRRMCDYAITEGSKIRIMPDVHSNEGPPK